jgi:hypothetical protein
MLSLGVLLALGVSMIGCRSRDRRTELRDYPEPRAAPVKAGPEEEAAPPPERRDYQPCKEDPRVVAPATDALRGRLTDAEKQEIGRRALFDLQRMMISSAEWLRLPDGDERTEVARDVLATKLEELGYHVVASTSELWSAPSEGEQSRFGERNDCNLVFLLEGEAKPADKFGDFFCYHSELKGKALNLTTHQEIASKTIRKEGRRALDEAEAAQDALESAAADMATYLTDEVARKWEATSLIRLRLVITDIDHIQEADDVRIGLQQRAGVYYVSLERWDIKSDTAVYEVLCRYDVREFLNGYVDELRNCRVQVQRVERGKVIKADQDLYD